MEGFEEFLDFALFFSDQEKNKFLGGRGRMMLEESINARGRKSLVMLLLGPGICLGSIDLLDEDKADDPRFEDFQKTGSPKDR